MSDIAEKLYTALNSIIGENRKPLEGYLGLMDLVVISKDVNTAIEFLNEYERQKQETINNTDQQRDGTIFTYDETIYIGGKRQPEGALSNEAIDSIIDIATQDVVREGVSKYIEENLPSKIPWWEMSDIKFTDGDEHIPSPKCMLFSYTDHQQLFGFVATSKGRIFRSDDSITWQVVENGTFFTTPFETICEGDSAIYAINQGGIIYSRDGGDTWNMVQP